MSGRVCDVERVELGAERGEIARHTRQRDVERGHGVDVDETVDAVEEALDGGARPVQQVGGHTQEAAREERSDLHGIGRA